MCVMFAHIIIKKTPLKIRMASHPEVDDYNDALKWAAGVYRNYLDSRGFTPNKFRNANILCRYGFEIEFASSIFREGLAYRVNSCIFNQNSELWRKSFKAFAAAGEPMLSDEKSIKKSASFESEAEFDEWSVFFLETSRGYHYPSFKGKATCETKGSAGFRIENDPSVQIEIYGPGVTLWSDSPDKNKGTDLRTSEGVWAENVKGLQDSVVVEIRNPAIFLEKSTEYTLRHAEGMGCGGCSPPPVEWTPGTANYESQLAVVTPHWGQIWNVPGRPYTSSIPERILNVYAQNELVSPVLHDASTDYPSMDPAIVDHKVPLGALAIDNLMNHMLGHKNVILTQRMGFHVHLSNYLVFPADNPDLKKIYDIGFVKLFYLFEPLIYSFFPFYRSESTYCQSIQSVFNLNEIKGPWLPIWEDLVNNVPISGVNRKERGDRYLSLNLTNCKPGGIGTIEVRLGHASFDSEFIQAYIYFLQTLMVLNEALIVKAQTEAPIVDGVRNPHFYINFFLSDLVIPKYCNNTSEEYNLAPEPGVPLSIAYRRRPLYGFFTSCGPSRSVYKKDAIENLIGVFYGITHQYDLLKTLIHQINKFHITDRCWNESKVFDSSINTFELFAEKNTILDLPRVALGWAGRPTDESYMGKFNKFIPILLGKNYEIAPGKKNVSNICTTCSEDLVTCSPEFNNGVEPVPAPAGDDSRLGSKYRYADMKHVYKTECDGRDLYSKTQTELISYKTSLLDAPQGHDYYHASGGRRKRKTRKQKKVRRKTMKGGRTNNNIDKQSTRASLLAKILAKQKEVKKLIEAELREKIDPNDPRIKEAGRRYKFNYQLRAGAHRITKTMGKDGKLIANYVDWLGKETESKELSKIFNRLIDTKTINMETLDLLCLNRLVDEYIFKIDHDYHIAKLISECAVLKIPESVVHAIRKVYKGETQISDKLFEVKKAETVLPTSHSAKSFPAREFPANTVITDLDRRAFQLGTQ
jgi:hypothetical protein